MICNSKQIIHAGIIVIGKENQGFQRNFRGMGFISGVGLL